SHRWFLLALFSGVVATVAGIALATSRNDFGALVCLIVSGLVLVPATAGAFMCRRKLWRVTLNRAFADKANFDFGTKSNAHDFLGSLATAKGSELRYDRPPQAQIFFIWTWSSHS